MPESAAYEDILYEVRGRAAWITINRPKIYNAFRGRTVEELISAFRRAGPYRWRWTVCLRRSALRVVLSAG